MFYLYLVFWYISVIISMWTIKKYAKDMELTLAIINKIKPKSIQSLFDLLVKVKPFIK